MYTIVTQVMAQVVVANIPTKELAETYMSKLFGHLMIVPSADVAALQASRKAELAAILA